MISPIFRDLLIEHIDGPVPIIVGDPHRFTRLRALRSLGLLRFDHGPRSRRPRQTYITERGRAALAEALADWADALVRAREAIQRLQPAAEAEPALESA